MKTTLLISLLAAGLDLCTNPFSDPTPVRVASTPCQMLNGQDRPYPCEFTIATIYFMGKNNEVLAQSTANGQVIKLPKSKAVSQTVLEQGGSLFYNVSVDFRRINKASFATPAYRLTRSSITDPISPGETTIVNNAIQVGPELPDPNVRPNRVMFKLQLNYANSPGSSPTLIAPIQLLMLENPVTYDKMTKPTYHHDRDRAEAWRTFQMSVSFTQ
ncbi:hypothetical protein [Larkinella soli]|uniref:hypothetical protein n=1 Tax=Larkinella soli TaxID=1770527 RepID=UPI000FFC625A|nr:hypothetical protein [Larkinella soli]